MSHRLSRDLADLRERYDVVVVGSGYGAAIAACRLSRAGQSVCILERGREHESFPRTMAEASEEVCFTLSHGDAPTRRVGNADGLYDFRVDDDVNVLQGNGLGGTSLINANVSLRPSPDVFEQPQWPAELTADGGDALERGFQRAEAMLEPTAYPADGRPLNKLAALRRSAEGLGAIDGFYRPPINVTFEDRVNAAGVEQKACTLCGDCVTGCNHGSKNTLTQNYLPDAVRHGAQIFTESAVRSVERTDDGWIVHFRRLGSGRDLFGADELFVRADRVVLGAGSLGSTEIMIRSRERGLELSDRLGDHFTGNGDVLAFAYNADIPIDGLGAGDHELHPEHPVGPCITGIVDLRAREGLARDMVIQDGALPGLLGSFAAWALPAGARVSGRDTDSGIADWLQERARILGSKVGIGRGAVQHTQTFLVMSHDDGEGRLDLDDDALRVRWPGYADQAIFREVDAVLERASAPLGATYVKNPASTDLLGERMVTVHPLGGCAMGPDAELGVVDHAGRAYSGRSGTAVHEGLYVLDGAIVPRPLGVNPLLTISALAERACEVMATEAGWTTDYSTWDSPEPAPIAERQHAVGVEFTETMRGWLEVSSGAEPGSASAAVGEAADSPFEFTLTVAIADVQAFARDPRATARMLGTAVAPSLSDAPMTIHDGYFRLFVPDDEHVRRRRMEYSMRLETIEGQSYQFDGWKEVVDDSGVDIVADTTTLLFAVDTGAGERVGAGQLVIEPIDFARQLRTMKATGHESKLEGLRALATFGRLFAGNLMDVYAPFFAPDSAPTAHSIRVDAPPRARRDLAAPTPEVIPVATDDGQLLRLTRYRAGDRRPVLLLHGLGVSSRIFSIDTIEQNLVEALCAAGHDVWLLDNRASIELPSAAERFDGDAVATYDYPAAVERIRELSGADAIDVVGHCYGGSTLFMAVLAGLEGVHSIVTSQTAVHVHAPLLTRLKSGLHLPDVLDLAGVDSLTAYAGKHPNWRSSILDQLLRLQPIQLEEWCSSSVCRRITFLYGQLYEHDRLNTATHDVLHEMFGVANVEALEHLGRLVRVGHLVAADGGERYLPHFDRLDRPITFIHGAENACFEPRSTRRTFDEAVQRFGPEQYRYHLIPDYGHIDCIFGANASRDVYPHILEHLDRVSPT